MVITLCEHLNYDNLIQITGNFSAVKRALLSVSSCFLENPRADSANSGATAAKASGGLPSSTSSHMDPFPKEGHPSGRHASDHLSMGYPPFSGPEIIGANRRMVLEEEVIFKLLCQREKVGSVIGKGGSVVRAMQNETGAFIKVADGSPDSDEKVIIISAREACSSYSMVEICLLYFPFEPSFLDFFFRS